MKKKLRKKHYYCDGKALCLELWSWSHTFTPVIKWHNSSRTPCPGQVPGGDSVQEPGELGRDTGSLYTSFATPCGSNKFLKKGGEKKKKKERIKEKINAEVKQNLVRTNILTTKKIIIINLSDKRKLDSKY